MILGRGYGFLGSAGGGVNEHFIHSKEYGFIVLDLV